jgi:hypothetical protein
VEQNTTKLEYFGVKIGGGVWIEMRTLARVAKDLA